MLWRLSGRALLRSVIAFCLCCSAHEVSLVDKRGEVFANGSFSSCSSGWWWVYTLTYYTPFAFCRFSVWLGKGKVGSVGTLDPLLIAIVGSCLCFKNWSQCPGLGFLFGCSRDVFPGWLLPQICFHHLVKLFSCKLPFLSPCLYPMRPMMTIPVWSLWLSVFYLKELLQPWLS